MTIRRCQKKFLKNFRHLIAYQVSSSNASDYIKYHSRTVTYWSVIAASSISILILLAQKTRKHSLETLSFANDSFRLKHFEQQSLTDRPLSRRLDRVEYVTTHTWNSLRARSCSAPSYHLFAPCLLKSTRLNIQRRSSAHRSLLVLVLRCLKNALSKAVVYHRD